MPGRYPLSLLTLTPRPARVGRACYRPAMSDHAIDPLDLEALVTEARALYAARRPQSRREHEAARVHLPGGNTRSVLHFEPFPYRVVGADGAVQTDADGHTYVDLCGNYTAGLFGHSASAVRAAVVAALDTGFSIGGIRAQEAELAGLLCRRFPSLEQVRFTNSGTEANLLAVGTALHHTSRSGVLVFDRGYHGGVLSFGGVGGSESPLNAPYDITVAEFDRIDSAVRRIESRRYGCVLVEPVQGSGGCRVADVEFLRALRSSCDQTETVLIFDEVMTSRLSDAGAQGHFGVTPDMTTLGKYLGGGMSFGAFGGRRPIMRHFDPGQGGLLGQAGTFNNNAASIGAAIAVLTEVLTTKALRTVNDRGERLRAGLNDTFSRHEQNLWATGLGSMLCLHAARPQQLELLFFHLLECGFFVAPRGFISLSFEVTDGHVDEFLAAVEEWCGP